MKNGERNYSKYWLEEENKFEHYIEKARREVILKTIGKYKPKTILDVGPGPNPICFYASGFDRISIVEPDNLFFNRISSLVHQNGIEKVFKHNCTLEEAKIKFKYDMIVISSVFHEIENIDKFMDKIIKLCHEDTIIHINVPNPKSIHKMLGVEMGLIKRYNEISGIGKKLLRVRELSEKELAFYLYEKGFRILEINTYLFKPFPSNIMSKIITDELYEGLMKLGDRFGKYGCEVYTNIKLRDDKNV